MGLSFALSVSAQDYDFGDVSKEELQETFNSIDSSAHACYLYKYRRTHIEYNQATGFQLITEVHDRVKIYDKEGLDFATKALRLYKDGSDEESLVGLKGYTYNLENDKITEDKLKKDGVFKTELSRYRNEKKFTMPNVKTGSIIEYKYQINSPFITKVDEFVFQHDIPVKTLVAIFETPEYFNFKVNTKGYIPISPKKSVKSGKILFTDKTRSSSVYGAQTKFSNSNINFKKNVDEFNLSDVPALKAEPYVNSIDNYRSSLNYELSFTRFPNAATKNYSTTWEDVIKTIYRSSSFGDELDKTSYFKDDIDALIGTTSDPIKRAGMIYQFVKSKIKWNGYYGYYVNDGVKKAYKDHVGNVAEINLMLTAMLNYAGVKAYPVLVSTRQNGIPLFPTREGYNYVITYVKENGQGFLLDATSQYCSANVLPYRVLNWQGRVITEHGNSQLLDLYPKELSMSSVSMMVDIDDEGMLTGVLRDFKTNHKALSYRINYNESNKDEFLEQLENKYKGIEISDFEVKNENDLSKPVIESYKFVKESQADIIGDKMYFSPLFFFKVDENPFKLNRREYPVDFGYPSETAYRININIPEGYKIEELPESGVFALPDNLGTFKYNVSGIGSKIQVLISTKINSPIISPLYYDDLKMYFSQLVEKEAEQIVLTKV